MDKPGEAVTKKTKKIRPRGQAKTSAGAKIGDSTRRSAAASNQIKAAPAVLQEDAQDNNDWTMKTSKRRKPPRHDALIIKPTEKLSGA